MEPAKVWTFETLLTHIVSVMDERDRRYEERFVAQQTAMNTAMGSAKEAMIRADAANEYRLDHLNKFREMVGDRDRQFIPRTEVEVLFHSLESKLNSLASRVDAGEGNKAGQYKAWMYLSIGIALLGFLVAMVARAWKI